MTTTALGTSRTIDLAGPTHYLDFGGPVDGPLVVAVHGLGGSAWNWSAVAPLLTSRCRMLAIDLAGHGRTPARGRSTGVRANRRLLDRFIREVAGEPVVLIGNSMGGLISALEAAAAPDVVRAAALVDPALPRPSFLSSLDPTVALQFTIVALPGLGEAAMNRRRRRQTPEQQVRETLALATFDPSRVPADVVAQGVELLRTRDGRDFPPGDFLGAARSLIRVLARPAPVRQRLRRISVPVLLMHGDKDRLVSVDVARATARALPDWRLEIAENVGHVPMLEDPEWTAAKFLDWMHTQVGALRAA
jgi:pimeloyl-ACP methyl ester carboxylesterase